MAEAIITRKGGSSGNATASDLLSGKTATVSTGDITGTMPNNGAVTITPSASNQTIALGYHNGSGTVVGDADLVSTNIKSGANIFGVAGNSNVVDTSAGTAVAGDILSGKIAFVDGAQITGTIASKAAQTYTPSTTNQTISSGQYLSGTQTISGDADLVAGNIKSGVNLFGVYGTLVPGISAYADLTAGEGTEVDTSAYVGGKLFLHTSVVSRTGGITYGSVTKTIQGWNGSSWVNICASSVGGSGTDVWLTDDDRAIINNNTYTKIKAIGSSANNAGSARFHSAFGAK